MRILVIGDGKVGHTLAENLAREEHSVVIVDNNEEVLQRSEDTLDVMCVRGNGANAQTLMDAEVDKADIVINAGKAGTAWSGGAAWADAEVVAKMQEWVYQGGCMIGVGEPSAVEGYADYFRMAQVLGVDKDTGAKVCHGKWQFDKNATLAAELIPQGAVIPAQNGVYLTDGTAEVLAEENGIPTATIHEFGKGKGIYLAGYQYSNANTRMLLQLMMYAKGLDFEQNYLTDCEDTECAYYPGSRQLVVINNSDSVQTTKIQTEQGTMEFTLEPFETQMKEMM